ncbi:monocarboxylate transporter 13 [Erpetoichthys calabaricus]|uniref:Monocarboxylate transporter 13 n=1 Tax=Erpetoichthys calabaricus TaxID=27687 RepID=A0A8C4X9Q2_ERPCA|nr:monocarboxylate transporter 13 [Erpetoichthys calabaricus]XP_051780835.1 monocarboxylate transporter 13 [Erpetoichthys calabaricus]XP_051780836.1 monocarboxylate transporter 13 [Erpetoichthys calabaricus]
MRPWVYTKPPDGDWGWMVVLSLFLVSALVFGLIRSFGVFFVEFTKYFEQPASSVSWITSIGVALQQFASPIASALCNKYGARPVVMVGGVLASLGLIVASLAATNLLHLYLSIGLLSGLGWALVFTPTVASVTRYFVKRRTLATGIGFTGVGVSSFAFSPLFQLLVEMYGWRGALLILGGLSLNLVVCGALLRPLVLLDDQVRSSTQSHSQKLYCHSWMSWQRLSELLDLSLLSHRSFITYVAAITFINTGYFVPYVHLVAHGRLTGLSEYEAAFVMSATAVTDLFGRVASGWFSDLHKFRLVHILAFLNGLTGISLLLIPLGTSFISLLALGLIYGFFSGALTPVVFSLLPEIVGLGRIFSALGLFQMIESIGGLLGAPLSGWLRDITGSFTVSFMVAGGLHLVGSFTLSFLPQFCSFWNPKSQKPELRELSNGTRPLNDSSQLDFPTQEHSTVEAEQSSA